MMLRRTLMKCFFKCTTVREASLESRPQHSVDGGCRLAQDTAFRDRAARKKHSAEQVDTPAANAPQQQNAFRVARDGAEATALRREARPSAESARMKTRLGKNTTHAPTLWKPMGDTGIQSLINSKR